MSGLDKMKARILEEAKSQAQEITNEAKAEAEAMLCQAKENAEAEAAGIRERAKRDAKEYQIRVDSSADMHRKQAVLATKQEIIGSVIEAAYEAVLNLDDEKYFGMLEKMLGRYALPENGVICFSAKDLERMPAGFSEKIKQIASQKGGALELSGKPENIDGGFLLVYGGIEENCTIRAVFASKRDELSDQVNRLLFG
nr:V-type ATP synthase subunit E [uncultured Mediterraneibacter sp.]